MAEALARDSGERWPDRTITAGRRTLGFVFINDDGSASAAGPQGEPLVCFENLEVARSAVVSNSGDGNG